MSHPNAAERGATTTRTPADSTLQTHNTVDTNSPGPVAQSVTPAMTALDLEAVNLSELDSPHKMPKAGKRSGLDAPRGARHTQPSGSGVGPL